MSAAWSAVPALLAAACVYRASAHQRLWPAAARPRAWRWVALPLLIASVAWAEPALGVTAALGIALSAAMLGCTLLPFADALRRGREPS